jgi:hypothetical protein
MTFVVETKSSDVICTPSSKEIGADMQNLRGTHTHAQSHQAHFI